MAPRAVAAAAPAGEAATSTAAVAVAVAVSDRARDARVAERRREAHWRRPPVRIVMAFCINCDACVRSCPPAFGAIFHHRHDVVVVPELCSGCGRCAAPVCPTDCIVVDDRRAPTPEAWWALPNGPEDPYV